ncbi:hypothetical protein HZC31_02560 [Candidatus Woesearchaeota archaeon]|nr:hypothetical protein [Candidatus Woesearchaeota archaeon]
MSIDLTLTREQALAEIGDLLPYEVPEWGKFKPRPGLEKRVVEGVMDASWTISEECTITQKLREWRLAQLTYGFAAEETTKAGRAVSCLGGIGILQEFFTWEQEQNLVLLGFSEDHTHHEMVYNALEHGAKYGARGPVIARFRGGTEGALMEITDPGRGRITAPLSYEQILGRLERAGRKLRHPTGSLIDFTQERGKYTSDSSHQPLDRGMGSISATIGKAVVSEYQSDAGYTVMLLYKPSLIPDYWKQAILEQRGKYLSLEIRRLLGG